MAGSKAGACGSTGIGGPVSALQICQPNGMGFDPFGNMFISNLGGLLRVDATTRIVTLIVAQSTADFITQMVFDVTGDIYFTYYYPYPSVMKLTAGSYTSSTFSTGPYGYPNGLAADGNGNFYVSDGTTRKIYKLNSTGGAPTVFAGASVGFAGDGGPALAAQFSFPFQLAFDSAGDLYISDAGTHSVRKITMSTGIISTVAGTSGQSGYAGDGGTATLAKLAGNYGVAFDAADNMWVMGCAPRCYSHVVLAAR